ncbi:MAG: glycosyltransferase [Terracidiphilus sp.]
MNHIAIVLPGIDPTGGAENQALLIAREMAKRGWRITVIAMSGSGGEAGSALLRDGISFFSLNMRKGFIDPGGWTQFRRWLRMHKPDVVHSHLPHATWLARWSRLLTPTRVQLDTFHSYSIGPSSRQLAYRLTRAIPSCVTAVSKAVEKSHVDAKLVDEDRFLLIPNGIDTERWKPDSSAREEIRGRLGLRDEFLWLAVGRLEPVKDYPTSLQALARLDESVHLAIAGDGTLNAPLRRLAHQLGIDARVHFLGFVQDPLRWLQGADGFVLASQWEGLPIALLEAAACALPVVATDVPGTWDIVTHGQNGLLAVAGSVDALASAMQRLIEMPQTDRQSLGERARETVMEQNDLNRVMDKWHALYTTLLEQNDKPLRHG